MGVGGNTHGVAGVTGTEVYRSGDRAFGTGAVGVALPRDWIGPVNEELGSPPPSTHTVEKLG